MVLAKTVWLDKYFSVIETAVCRDEGMARDDRKRFSLSCALHLRLCYIGRAWESGTWDAWKATNHRTENVRLSWLFFSPAPFPSKCRWPLMLIVGSAYAGETVRTAQTMEPKTQELWNRNR